MPSSKSPSDGAIDALISQLQQTEADAGQILWIADEHPLPSQLFQLLKEKKGVFLSNRFDQHQQAKTYGVESQFSDFDLAEITQSAISTGVCHIFFRAAKERPVVHRVINQAKLSLTAEGCFWITGYKNEGIKTHIKRAEECFDSKAEIRRDKNQLYIAKLTHSDAKTEPLIDNDYSELRQIESDGLQFWTKPGLYGWDKVDQGSKYLMDWLVKNTDGFAGQRVLDLGCGYGYLSMRAAAFGETLGENENKAPAEIVATDNCIAALAACEKNLAGSNSQISVLASDAGKKIPGQFDTILCNPPFHQGFSTTPELHERFIRETKRLLAPNGKAWFVVNQFLSLDVVSQSLGLRHEEFTSHKGFKVLRMETEQ